MEPASPARLYAAAVGALLLVLGLVSFFYTASFGGLDEYEDALGWLQVNGWIDLLYLATGGLGLLMAGVAARRYSLAMGVLFTALAILGWGSATFHLVLGLLGIAAVASTATLKPRPQAAGKGS
ncbi:MAG TPA: DUF4383 domain-containing protein [Solirubrobacterales bacterium]|nr:DUF4383 domain-containing protein [Solirubrobacterales bacterium]